MDDTRGKSLPGTAQTRISQGEKGFAKIAMLLEATGGLNLSQVCSVTGLEGSTIQNWVKRGWVAHPKGKKYEEKHIARILIINALKECIKLEHIAQLMIYVNGEHDDLDGGMVKESDLYNFLCDALPKLGKVDDLSRGGVESVVENVIRDYKGPTPDAHIKIRKALTLMIYACVCTDVKRRTETMMDQVLYELEHPESEEAENPVTEYISEPIPETAESEVAASDIETDKTASNEENKKTIAQALREWDLTRVESIINEDDGLDDTDISHETSDKIFVDAQQPVESPEKSTGSSEKPAQKPWYFRRN